MKVKLLEITEQATRFAFTVTRNRLQKLDPRFVFDELHCQATLSRNQEFVELKGTYQASIQSDCDRCLCPITVDLDEAFRLELVSEENHLAPEGDLELSMDSADLDFYENDEIDLIRYFEDQIILDLPFTVVCDDDCKGLCSTCGQDLNKDQCSCHLEAGDNPFSVLKDWNPDKT